MKREKAIFTTLFCSFILDLHSVWHFCFSLQLPYTRSHQDHFSCTTFKQPSPCSRLPHFHDTRYKVFSPYVSLLHASLSVLCFCCVRHDYLAVLILTWHKYCIYMASIVLWKTCVCVYTRLWRPCLLAHCRALFSVQKLQLSFD